MNWKILAAAAMLGTGATSSFAVDTPITLTGGSGPFGATRTGSFSDNFTFVAAAGSTVSSAVTSINLGGLQDVALTSVTLTTGAGFGTTVATFATGSTGAVELRTLAASPVLAGGLYAISVAGTVTGGSGSYSGVVNVVPEPGTYALMAVGLAFVGFVARGRKLM